MIGKRLNSSQRVLEAVLLVVILATAYMMLALLSYEPLDPSWLHKATLGQVQNHSGRVGAWLADTFFSLFGLPAYAIPVVALLFTLSSLYMRRNCGLTDRLRVALPLVGGVFLLLSTCGIAELYFADPANFSSGGVFGSLIVHSMLPWFNYFGTGLMLIFLWGVGFTLFTGCSWLMIAEKSGSLILVSLSTIGRSTTIIGHYLFRVGKCCMVSKKWQFGRREGGGEDTLHGTPPSHWTEEASVQPHPLLGQIAATVPYATKRADGVDSPNLKKEFAAVVQGSGERQQVGTQQDQEVRHHRGARNRDRPIGELSPEPRKSPIPSLELLAKPPVPDQATALSHEELERTARLVEERLADYRVEAKVVGISPGPVITRYELRLAPGLKASRISTLARDLARSLSVMAVRVVEVIPGKPYVGLELPNRERQTVYLREGISSVPFKKSSSPLTIVLGKDSAGQPLVADLSQMPHLLVAGTTGSGKSVGVNTMIISMLYKATPEDVRFIMIDPKMLELSVYDGIPHLLTEVVTDMKDAANALRWCVNEMERRYKLMSLLGVRGIGSYNERLRQAESDQSPILDPTWQPSSSMDATPPILSKMPYIVVLVDEFADLMMTVGKKVEELLARLAQKARAAGIHLVLATQRPSVDVITGLIKANIPTRIAFTVSSKIDSRTILDQAGAESLLGMGDMLYLAPNSSLPIRVHGSFVSDKEVHAVVEAWKACGRPQYLQQILDDSEDDEQNSGRVVRDEGLDPLFDEAVAFVAETGRGSISGVQRKFKIGYNRAARIIEQMEAEGIVSAPNHSGGREVLVSSSTR